MKAFNLETIKKDLANFDQSHEKMCENLAKENFVLEREKIKINFLNTSSNQNILKSYYEYFNNFISVTYFAEYYSLSEKEVAKIRVFGHILDSIKYNQLNTIYKRENKNFKLFKVANQFLLAETKNSFLKDCIIV